MHSFEYYKDNVSIVQVAEALGYELNKKAGRNPLEYKHPDQNTIVISNPKGRQRYFTRHESDNKGSVIDFVKHRLSQFQEYYTRESEGINKVLASFAGVPHLSGGQVHHACQPGLGGQAFTSPSKKLWLSEKKAFNLNEFRLNNPEPKDLLYLSKHRGITNEALKTFIPHIQLVKVKNKPTTNIGFPYQVPGKNEIVGFELVNYLFKGHARGSNKSEGLWMADLSGTGFPPKVFIAESAIDAMSFYQLYKQKHQLHKAAFISTGGYVTDKQLRNVLQRYSSSKIHTLFDNDISGHLYDIRTACMKANTNLRIHKDQNEFNFQLNNRSFSLTKGKVCLTNFRKESGLQLNISVHKAKGKDFNEMLMDRAKEQVNRSIKI